MKSYFCRALKLHRYLAAQHWNGHALIGPDVGIRFNYRAGRFVKGFFPYLPWNDNYYYVQTQGYWALDNWMMFAKTREQTYRDIAVRCSEYMLNQQRLDGAWVYPNREWKGRIATAEGTWGSLGLLETFRQTGDTKFLAGALQWHHFMEHTIGFQQVGDTLAVNYFAYRTGSRVPNNSAFVLRFLAELASSIKDESYLQPCDGLLRFMKSIQAPSGEFPYAVSIADNEQDRSHFQCYQYNAFECLDIMRYYEITADISSLPLITKNLQFLEGGLGEDGHVLYACGNQHRAVTYHVAVLAAAFTKAYRLGISKDKTIADRAYSYLLELQRQDGSFPHSIQEYYILSDRRSYPRNLSMILYHLLISMEE